MGELEKHLQNYLDYMRGRNYAKRSIEDMKWHIRYLINWLKEKNIDNVTREAASQFQLHLLDKRRADTSNKLSLATQKKYLTCIKIFFDYLLQSGKSLENPFAALSYPRIYQKMRWELLSAERIAALLQKIKHTNILHFRNSAMLCLLYAAGIRINELIEMHLCDIDYEQFLIKIRCGKGGKERIIPVSGAVLGIIKIYVLYYRQALLKTGGQPYLFLSESGKKLYRANINYTIKKIFGGSVSAHCLRVACATHMHKNGADIRYIQEQLGHKTIDMTERYIKLEKSELKRIHSLTHPAERNENL